VLERRQWKVSARPPRIEHSSTYLTRGSPACPGETEEIKGCVHRLALLFAILTTTLTTSAENDALRKAAAAKETAATMIPRPQRGTAGNGFNLQAAMGLEDDYDLYATLRVS
jgi:hypothetical protein